MKKGLAVDVIQRDAVCVYILLWACGWGLMGGGHLLLLSTKYIYIYILEGVCVCIYTHILRITRVT